MNALDSGLAIAGVIFLACSLGGYLLIGKTGSGLVVAQERTQQTMQKQLTGLFMFADAGRLSIFYLLLLPVVPVLLVLLDVNLAIAATTFVVLLLAPRVIFAILAKRRATTINQALPDGLTQIASSMRAGATFTVAIQGVVEEDKGPLGEELSLLMREHRMGARMDDALDNLAERVQSEEMDLIVSAVTIAQDVGGNLAEILQSLAVTIRRKIEMEGKVAALTAQGVLQGYVVSALPFVLLGALRFAEPECHPTHVHQSVGVGGVGGVNHHAAVGSYHDSQSSGDRDMSMLNASWLIGAGLAVVLWQVMSVFTAVPTENRLYRDVPATGFRLIWPLIRLIVFYAEQFMSDKALELAQIKLSRAGVEYSLSAKDLLASRIVAGVLFAMVGLMLVLSKGTAFIAVVPVAALLGYSYPNSWLKQKTLQRQTEILKALPFYLDVITLTVESGSNLTGGLTQAVQKTTDSPLRRELSRVLRDIRSGKSRADALREFSNRVDSLAVNQVVAGLIQGEKAGANLGPLLRAQSEQLRTQRFQLAEKKAMQAPVKLLAPLFVCIFPMVFIVLAFVVVVKLIQGGIVTWSWLLWAYTWPG